MSNTSLTGEPIRVNTNRQDLARAAKLGFREVCLFGKDQAVLTHDERRQYQRMLPAADGAIPPADSALRIESPMATRRSIPHHRIKEPNVTQPNSKTAGVPAVTTTPIKLTNPTNIKTPVEQAIAPRDTLYLAARQANDLARSLKRQKRQNRLVETTLASLRQPQAAS